MFSWDEVKFDFCRFLLSLLLELVRGFKFIKLNNFNSILDMIFLSCRFVVDPRLRFLALRSARFCGFDPISDWVRDQVSYELGTDSIWNMN